MPSGDAKTPRPRGSEKAHRKMSNPARTDSPAEHFDDPGFSPKARPIRLAAAPIRPPTEQNVATCSQEGDGDISAEVGAVEMLVVWENLEVNRHVLVNNQTGDEQIAYLTPEQELELAAESGHDDFRCFISAEPPMFAGMPAPMVIDGDRKAAR